MKKLFCLLLMIASSFAALAQTSIAGVAFGSDYTSAKNNLKISMVSRSGILIKTAFILRTRNMAVYILMIYFLISNIRVQEDILISAFL